MTKESRNRTYPVAEVMGRPILYLQCSHASPWRHAPPVRITRKCISMRGVCPQYLSIGERSVGRVSQLHLSAVARNWRARTEDIPSDEAEKNHFARPIAAVRLLSLKLGSYSMFEDGEQLETDRR